MSEAAHLPRFDRDGQYGAQLNAFAMAAQTSLMPTMIADSVAPGFPIVFANDAFLAMSGFSRNALVASPIEILFGAAVNAKSLVLLTTTIASGGAGIWQMSVQRANGSTFLAVVYLSPLVIGDEEVVKHVINVYDLASLICMSRDKEETYPALYDKVPGFIALSNGSEQSLLIRIPPTNLLSSATV